jgi:hypothetical protein
MSLAAIRARIIQIISEQQLRLTADQAAKRADEYIKFIKLQADHLKVSLAPSHAIDQVWRSHSLDTQSYQQLQTLLMPDGGCIHHNPWLMKKSLTTQTAYASTLSLLLGLYGKLDTDSWPIDESEYRKLNVMVTSAEHVSRAIAGPQIYCYKKQDVLALVRLVQLVMGYTPDYRFIITGMSFDYLPRSTQQVRQTDIWRSATVRVTSIGDAASIRQSDSSVISSIDCPKYLRFCSGFGEIEVREPYCILLS